MVADDHQLFSTIKFFITSDHGSKVLDELGKILEMKGGTKVDLHNASHIIAKSPFFEGKEKVRKDAAIVSLEWVERSFVHGKLMDVNIFSVDPRMIFSGVIATTSDLDSSDREVIQATLNALGGLYREGYTRDITHILVPRPGSDKYNTALHFSEQTHVKIVLPNWFDDCFRLLQRLDEAPYSWPDPPILQNGSSQKKLNRLPQERRTVINMAKLADDSTSLEIPFSSSMNVWKGRKILLSHTIGWQEGRREAVEVAIQRVGGKIVPLEYSSDPISLEKEEELKVNEADVLIIQKRISTSYLKAMRAHKTIGTLAWLFHVHKTGVISSPQDQLLHYPVRGDRIPGFETHKITLTNYSGEAREYLKKLISLMGGEDTFTPEMSQANSVVVAASLVGKKAEKAREWSLPIVNHTWLEDCFVSWKKLTPALDKYVSFSDGVDYASIVGIRGVGSVVSGTKGEEDLRFIEAEIKKLKEAKKENLRPSSSLAILSSSAPSNVVLNTRDVDEQHEVEEVIGLGNTYDDGDHSFIDLREDRRERPPTKSPLKKVTPTANKGKSRQLSSDDEVDEKRDKRLRSPAKPTTKNAKTHEHRTNLVNKGKSDRRYEEEEEEEEEEPEPPKRTLRSRQAAVQDDAVSETLTIRSKTKKPIIRAKGKKGKEAERESSDEESDESEVVLGVTPTKGKVKEVVKGKGKATRTHDTDDEDVEEDREKDTTKKIRSSRKVPPKSNTKSRDVDSDSEEDDARNKNKAKTMSKTSPQKAVDFPFKVDFLSSSEDEIASLGPSKKRSDLSRKSETDDEETEDEPPSTRTRSAAKTPQKYPQKATVKAAKASSSKTRAKSPSIRSTTSHKKVPVVEIESPKGRVKSTASYLARNHSLHAEADEEARPNATPKRKHSEESENNENDSSGKENDDSRRKPPPSKKQYSREEMIKHSSRPSPIIGAGSHRSPSRRAAKASAAAKLKDSAEDITKFQKEMRAGKIRGYWEKDEKGKKKEVDTHTNGHKRRRERSETVSKDEENSEDTDEEMNLKDTKKAKRSKRDLKESDDEQTQKKNKKARFSEDLDSDVERRTDKGKKRASDEKSDAGDEVRVLTTMVKIDEDTKRAFSRLGATFIDKPQDCTHLVAASIVRSSKFLRCMVNGPDIVSSRWVYDSVKARRILPPDGYEVPDPENRQAELNFKLAEALKRARNAARPIFSGKTFFVTPNVASLDDVKAIIKSAGGQVKTEVPTLASFRRGNDRFIVSCLEDRKLWRSISEAGFKIHGRELVITSVLTQKFNEAEHELDIEES